MSTILDKVTEENWQGLAREVAEEVFPVGSLVQYGVLYLINFGLVSSITSTGKINIITGNVPLIKITDQVKGGFYAKLWYDSDVKNFIPNKEDKLERGFSSFRQRFSPIEYNGDNWRRYKKSPIQWYRGASYFLIKPKINEEGLIMQEYYD